jgi:hypothetical protein
MMRLEEWQPFQDRFGQHQLLHLGDPDVAMFSQSHPGDDLSAIYIHGPGLDAVEGSSPGGWDDSSPPSGKNVVLLVGAAGAFERFGIKE